MFLRAILTVVFTIGVTSRVFAGSILLQSPTATYSQQDFSVAYAIDDPSTLRFGAVSGQPQPSGWSIYSGDPNSNLSATSQTAVFQTVQGDPNLPVGASSTLLTFTLDFQYEDTYWGADSAKFNLGDFRLSVTGDDRSTFADGLSTGGNVTANWTVLTPISVVSTDPTTSFTVLGDGSILANPDSANVKQTYTVTALTSLANITGFRLEALENSSLALDGPGRFPLDGNFALTNFAVDATPAAVPEPGSLSLLGVGMIMAASAVRRRRRSNS